MTDFFLLFFYCFVDGLLYLVSVGAFYGDHDAVDFTYAAVCSPSTCL